MGSENCECKHKGSCNNENGKCSCQTQKDNSGSKPEGVKCANCKARDSRSSEKPSFTSESYPSLKRDPRYATLSQKDIDFFKGALAKDGGSIVTDIDESSDPSELDAFNIDWTHKYRGKSRLVIKPKTTEQVSQILKYCNSRRLAVVPQGGNTGFVGGSIPVFDEIIINLGLMNHIHGFDELTGILNLDAGVILEDADNYLVSKDHIFPLDIGARKSCQVGGCASTSAGGLRLMRYGNLHGNIIGMEAVLPDGTILNNLVKVREGYLGIITRLSVVCPQKPRSTNAAFLGLPSYNNVLKAFSTAKFHLSEILSAFELMDNTSQIFMDSHSSIPRPIKDEYPFYVFIETQGSSSNHDHEKLCRVVEELKEQKLIGEGAIAKDDKQIDEFVLRRVKTAGCLQDVGSGIYKYDVSLPLDILFDLVYATKERLKDLNLIGDAPGQPVIDVVGFGHVGDGNLHMNVLSRKLEKKVEDALEPWVFAWVASHEGSISSEHGLGFLKKPYVGYSKTPEMISLMKTIKHVIDPNGIMLPYKYVG
ncbi:D-lactate dehydrogenase [Schizosaccharomyces octosporus yFS286]|uniref:D-lactate dehydrogenase n=1 Tax=Schizosaccharomyces octosporus (strain yFS286) TaxID=483514 RepID=S9PUK5_SCHOY|nr:D-lactate dehydrogenase [Schizosaccharomyces octosporus yFS286]EPX71652.1 D-lactate dehydrogenase [Schizosaccharomyces octosporus yFS286]